MSLATSSLQPTTAGFANLGTTELILIILVVLLLFGGKKLPEMARGTGKALRIFKAETKGLLDDDADEVPPQSRAQLPPSTGATAVRPTESTEYTAPQALPPTHTEK